MAGRQYKTSYEHQMMHYLIDEITPEQVEQARALVHRNAKDEEDEKLLLAHLGLIEKEL